jgi:hypothetical protein
MQETLNPQIRYVKCTNAFAAYSTSSTSINNLTHPFRYRELSFIFYRVLHESVKGQGESVHPPLIYGCMRRNDEYMRQNEEEPRARAELTEYYAPR